MDWIDGGNGLVFKVAYLLYSFTQKQEVSQQESVIDRLDIVPKTICFQPLYYL